MASELKLQPLDARDQTCEEQAARSHGAQCIEGPL